MRRYLSICFIILLPNLVQAQWRLLPDTSLVELYVIPDAPFHVETRVTGTTGLSWPNGNQAIVTLLEVVRGGEKRLHRCIDYYTPEMQITGSSCYLLVAPEE